MTATKKTRRRAATKPSAVAKLRQAAAHGRGGGCPSWYDVLPADKKAIVDEVVAALPTIPGATYALAWRTLTDDGVISCRVAAFREHIRQVRHGSGN